MTLLQDIINNDPLLKLRDLSQYRGSPQSTDDAAPKTDSPTTSATSMASTIPTAGDTTSSSGLGYTAEDLMSKALSIQDKLNKLAQEEADKASFRFSDTTDDGGGLTDYDPDKEMRDAYNRLLRLHQSEIDATNVAYDQLVSQARLEGQGRLGSQRAMAARGGLLGSDFAASQKSNIQKYNTGIVRGLQAERNAAIGNILGRVKSSALQEIQLKNEARKQEVDEYIKFLSPEAKRARRNEMVQDWAAQLIASGYDVEDFSDEEWEVMLKGSDVSKYEMAAGVAQLKAAEGGGDTHTLKPGEVLVDSSGREIARGNDEPVVLKEGDVVLDADGNVVTKINKTATPRSSSGAGGDLYTADDIPGDIRADLWDDAKAGIDINSLVQLYPEVSESYIQDVVDEQGPEVQDEPWWSKIWGD